MMRWSWETTLGIFLASIPAILAHPHDESICDTYTKELFKDNTGSNQYAFISRLVNTLFIGNYSESLNGVKVTGILSPGDHLGQTIDLLPYFNGALVSTNRGDGRTPTVVNFLDDGGALPLALDRPAYGSTSNQYRLITHFYQFFGAFLECTKYGESGFPVYQGDTRMYEVHKHMNLNSSQVGYFVQEFRLAAMSLGVPEGNVTHVAAHLSTLFGERCSAPTVVVPDTEPELQNICMAETCPTAYVPECDSYNSRGGSGVDPSPAEYTDGPLASDIAVQLHIIAFGEPPPQTGPFSYTTVQTTLTTFVDGEETTMVTQVPAPIGGGVVTTATEFYETDGGYELVEVTSTIPLSVVQMIPTVITESGTVITTLVPTTVANTAAPSVFEIDGSRRTVITSTIASGGTLYTTTYTTYIGSSTTSQTRNAAAAQTAAPMMMAMAGIGLVAGQLL